MGSSDGTTAEEAAAYKSLSQQLRGAIGKSKRAPGQSSEEDSDERRHSAQRPHSRKPHLQAVTENVV